MSKRTDLKIIVLALMIWAGMVVIPQGAYASEVLRVGVISSLNGSQASVGQEVQDGALLAIQQIHEGWKEKDARIEAVLMDDGSSPERAKEVALKLIQQDKVDLVFGVADSDCALAIMPIMSQSQIPMLSLATHEGLTRPPQKWIFRGNISDEDECKILVDLMWERLSEKRVALLFEDTAYGRSAASAQQNRLRQYGVTPVAAIPYSRGVTDFSSALEQIQAAEPEGILIYGMASDAPSILRKIRELGMEVRIMASSGWDTRRVSDLSPNLTQGIVVAGYLAFADRNREDELGPSWLQFAQAFQERFGREPDVMAGLSYSNMMCLAEAWARVGFQTQQLVRGLEETKGFNTLLETRINYSDEGRDGFKRLHLAELKDGKPVEWKRNLFARDYRFGSPSRPLSVEGYEGKIYEGEPGISIWMLLHFAFGRPPFLKEFAMIDEYGLKSCFVGSLFRGEVRVPVFRLIFRSEKEAIEALNIGSPEGEEGDQQTKEPLDRVNYRNSDSGVYTDGTFWSGYRRVKNVLALAEGGIPREDLEKILDLLLQPADN